MGFTADASKLFSGQMVGRFRMRDNSATTLYDVDIRWTGSIFRLIRDYNGVAGTSDVTNVTPFAWAVDDELLVEMSVPVEEYRNFGSVPAIGVEEAGDGVVGLAGPTEFIADPGGETCTLGCTACDVLNMKTIKIGNMYQTSFRLFMTASAASRVHCDFDMQVSSNLISGLDWTGVSEGHGVCNDATFNNFTSGGTGSMVSASDERWDMVVQGPVDTSSRAYSCVATFVKAIP